MSSPILPIRPGISPLAAGNAIMRKHVGAIADFLHDGIPAQFNVC